MRVAIVGCGRIGRALFRLIAKRSGWQIVAINDINPDPKNLAYLLQYDSEYGRSNDEVIVEDSRLRTAGHDIALFQKPQIEDVPWGDLGVDLVFDASGVHRNVLAAHKVIAQGVRKVVITHSPEEVDHTLVLGANEDTYRPEEHHVVSSSICDAVAVSPVLSLVDRAFGIESGFLTTLHPWLSYQNLLDGPSYSWSSPGTIYHHFAVGRASTRALIPKPTSAIEATMKVLPHLDGALRCMSFRVPTPVVGAANLYLRLTQDLEIEDVRKVFAEAESHQKWPILHLMEEPLVSIDFLGMEYSAIVDQRWTDLAGARHLYIVLWYDNEMGYANHAVHLAEYLLRS